MAGKKRVRGAVFQAKVALAARGDRTTSTWPVSPTPTGQVTAWKKHLLARVAEPFAEGRQRRDQQATVEAGSADSSARLVGTGATTSPMASRRRTWP